MTRVFHLIALISFVYIAYVFADAHRVRAALIATQKVSEKKQIDERDALHYDLEDQLILKEYSSYIPERFEYNNGEQLEEFLQWFTENYFPPTHNGENYMQLAPEYPDLLLERYNGENYKGSCYNDAILFSFLLQVNGYVTRNISFINEDGYGRNGHTLLEVWQENLNKWVLVDAQNSAVFFNNKEALSAFEIRDKLLSQTSDEFYSSTSIHQYQGFNTPSADLYKFYKRNCSELAISSFNNPVSRVSESYLYKVAYYFSQKESRTAEKFSRFLRSLLDKSRVNYIWEDEHSSSNTYVSWYYGFNSAVFLLISYLMFLLIRKFTKR